MAQQHQVEVHSPVLDAFLRVSPPRRLLGKELLDHLRIAMAPVTATWERPSDEGLPHRIMACWRLSRAFALVAGICAEDEPLDAATELTPSPWTSPTLPAASPTQQQLIRLGAATALHFYYKPNGLPLLPPRYDEELAQRWCKAAALIAESLHMERGPGSAEALNCLLVPEACGYAGVTEQNVLALEELLIDEAQKLIIEVGERPAMDHFRVQYNFSRKEAIGLIRLARADALTSGSTSIEEDRALMVVQLKDLIARAKEEMSTDKELRALKELARVQGLTRSEPEDLARTFLEVIANTARRQDARVIDAQARVVRSLPQQTSEYVPAEAAKAEAESGDPEDAEALAEYDRENR